MVDLFRLATIDFIALTLIFFRMSSLSMTMPFFGGNQIPMQVRMAFVIAFTFLIYNTIDLSTIIMPTSIWQFAGMIARELAIGILIGTIGWLAFFAIQFGGEIIGIQMALNRAQAIDPLSSENVPTIGQLLTLFIMSIFLIVNGHHYLLRVFIDSFEFVPIFSASFSERIFEYLISSFGIVIDVGMRIAIPSLVFAFTLRLVFGFMARLVPQMNIFILSMPFQIIGGVVVLSICLPLIVVLFHDTFGKTLEEMYRILILL